jgi:hypothetical protein
MPNKSVSCVLAGLAGLTALVSLASVAEAQGVASLGRFFGFEDPRILVVDENPGPAMSVDLDDDGRMDLVIANNRKSRIEVYRQRATPRTDEDVAREYKVNKLPPSPWFDRSEISVAHRVTAMRAHDVDGDGRLDLVYAGQPAEIVILRQSDVLTFDEMAKRRVRGLGAGQDGFEIADVSGTPAPELLAIVDGRIEVFELGPSGVTGEPQRLGTGGQIVAFFVEDYDGDRLADICGVIPQDSAPVRMWLQTDSQRGRAKQGVIGPELRFEMPPLIEIEPIRFPDRRAASIGVIEQATRRIVLYDVTRETIDGSVGSGVSAERDAPAEVHSYLGGKPAERSVAVADINADGLEDLLVTDPETNSVVLYLQDYNVGIGDGQQFSAFKEPKTVAAGQWDDDEALEVFVLSEEEKTVGISDYNMETGRLGFPQPLRFQTAGASPVAMNAAEFNGEPGVMVVLRDRRDHTLEIHRPGSETLTVELEGVNRPPQSMLAGDFDLDGRTDLILFTPNEPMVMVRSTTDEAGELVLEVLTDDGMPQYGLVQAAGPENTALLDIDGDGSKELLIADENFVRASRYDAADGWRVIDQVTLPDSSTTLAGLSVLESEDGTATIVASDKGSRRLVLMSRSDEDGSWAVSDKLRLSGFELGPIRAGAFAGDGEQGILALSNEGFALVRLAGDRTILEEFAAFRSDEEDRLEHEMEVGDVNGDGFVDLIVLDAREQYCQVFTLSAARKLYFAMEFKVFESRLFSGGGGRQYEPSAAIISDVTGNGAEDVVLQVHDRYLIYPQMLR